MTTLGRLSLHSSQVTNLGPLSSVPNLQELDLTDNKISDISPLSRLADLRELYLNYNQVSQLDALRGLTNLTDLMLKDNQITDISPLENNPGIGSGDNVDIEGNQIDCIDQADNISALLNREVNLRHDCELP